MDTEEPRKTSLTYSETVETILKNTTTSQEATKKTRELLDNALKKATNDKDKLIFTMLMTINQDSELGILTETVNILLLLNLLKSERLSPDTWKSIEKMQKDIVKIKETHSPIIDLMKEAIERKNKVLGDNR